MQMQFQCNPADLLAAVGPSIGGCCYEVGTEVATQFLSQFAEAPNGSTSSAPATNPIRPVAEHDAPAPAPPKNVLLDLRKANRAQLLAAGVHAHNIFVSDLCTACRRDLLFSYRKEGPRAAA